MSVPAPSPTPPSAPQHAAGSSFYTAMKILPPAQRAAMFEIYGFCRRVDDIADSDAPRAERLIELAAWRADVNALYAGQVPPRVAGLAKPMRDFDLAKEDFLALIDGMEMDAFDDIRGPSAAILDLYCDRVASAVGRLSVRVFGIEREAGKALAHHLGRALQLTNILRDLDEDAGVGRLYLPREALAHAGITTNDPKAALRSAMLGQACAELVARAREHFTQAEAIMARLPRRSVRAPRIMGLVYRAILDRLVARGWSAPRQPIRLPRARLLWIVLRHALV
ncbi:MAG TPA: presqualene diphosphate synthase HpnD [Xanthobacteraceae bacterium]|nr:presqualene diphosphate synthase HpnD [Xanthobacteraceae bacterium]